jgi:hypothetical protein
MSTTQELDRDGFTAAERAYFESGGKVTEGLLNNEPDDEPVATPESATPEPQPAAPAPAPPDPNADPFEDLEKVVKDNRAKTHKLIPEQNFRVVSEKYKTTKKERDELQKRLEALEGNSKSWQDELAKEREMRARIDERLKLFNEVIAPAAEPTAQRQAPPNPEEDIFGYLKWRDEEQERRFNELADRVGQTSQTIQSDRDESNLRSAYQQDATRFAQANPDFAQAYNHLNKVRDMMLENAGYTDPKQREQIRLNEERDLVTQTLKSGKSPAEVVYSIAKTLGYATSAAAPAAPAPAPAAQQPSVTAEIERLQKAQAASKTLSGSGGSAPAPMTVQALAAMSDEEFERYARKNPAVVKQLMGG